MTIAWSGSTASSWDQGVLAGTGVVGAVVHGDPESHVLTFAHERFFVPANSRKPAPELASALPDIRAALLSGRERDAADHVDKALRDQDWDPTELIWTDPLGPVAQLAWVPDSAQGWSGYRREISLDSGSCAVSWSLEDGGRAGLRIYGEHGVETFTIELWSTRALTGTLRLSPVKESAANASTVLPLNYGDRVRTSVSDSNGTSTVLVEAEGVTPGTAVTARATLVVDDHTERAENGVLHVDVNPDRPRLIAVRLSVSPGPVQESRPSIGRDLAAERGLVRSSLKLASSAPDESTESIWQRARQGARDAELAVVELAYSAGLRNIAASSGDLPPTLQGVWQGTWSPAWSADYTLNGNVQLGSLAAALWTGNPEIMKSLFRLVVPHADHYRSNAQRIHGLEGMLLPSRMTTHGHANHFLRDYPHQFWAGSGPWFLRMAADYIQVTGDVSIIDDWFWDFTVGVLQFSMGYVDAGAGRLNPSYSPENTPTGRENPLATDAAADIAALRDAFGVGIWLAEIRNDPEKQAAWADARDRVPAFSVGTDGALAEWAPQWEQNVAHRHASQLQGLWYEPDPLLTTGSLRAAAELTVKQKVAWRAEAPEGPPGNMEMAFGLSSIGIAAAALGDAVSAYQCVLWLARDHFSPSLATTHDAGAIFNLDASGALPAVVASMLLSSSAEILDILPALPAEWPVGEVTGLTARGGVTVNLVQWDERGVRLVAEFPSATRWLRPDGTTIRFPRATRMVDDQHLRVVDDRTVHVPAEAERVDAYFSWGSDQP